MAIDEGEIQRASRAGEHDRALELALRAYGREIGGFLLAIHQNEADASDVFAAFSEQLWTSLPAFRWESSLRTFAYTLARRASSDLLRGPARHQQRHVPLEECSALSRLPAAVRTETAAHLRSDARERFAAVRARLSPRDNALLVLRVERRLRWHEIAEIMLEEEGRSGAAPADGAALERESARLRKRYEKLKKSLVELGRREGLVPGKDRGA